MTFKQAVEATPSIQDQYCAGLGALVGNHSGCVRCANARRFKGSVNLDEALQPTLPNANRWDYGIGFSKGKRESAVWVEVHPASSSSITTMLDKLAWLREWLQNQAPVLRQMTEGDYYWVATDGTVSITANSPQAKRLAAAGLIGPRRVVILG
jgi:hypothetical protein